MFDIETLEQDLLVFNRMNDARLEANLEAGDAFGLTDVVLNLNEPKRNQLEAWVDNYGFETTGREQLGILGRRYELFAEGDRSLLYTLVSEGARSVAAYSAPLGPSRFRLGGNASYTESEIIEGPFENTDTLSTAASGTIELSYLAYSDISRYLTLIASTSVTDSTTETVGQDVVDTSLYRHRGGISYTEIGTNWQTSLQLTGSYANNNNHIAPVLSDEYHVLNASLVGLWRYAPNYYFLLQSEGQYTDDIALPDTLAFNVGGASTLRGYEPGTASGDGAWYTTGEWHCDGLRLSQHTLDAFVFYDHGGVDQFTRHQTLSAAGIGFSMYGASGVSLDMRYGYSLTTPENNQGRDHLYIRLSYQFI